MGISCYFPKVCCYTRTEWGEGRDSNDACLCVARARYGRRVLSILDACLLRVPPGLDWCVSNASLSRSRGGEGSLLVGTGRGGSRREVNPFVATCLMDTTRGCISGTVYLVYSRGFVESLKNGSSGDYYSNSLQGHTGSGSYNLCPRRVFSGLHVSMVDRTTLPRTAKQVVLAGRVLRVAASYFRAVSSRRTLPPIFSGINPFGLRHSDETTTTTTTILM